MKRPLPQIKPYTSTSKATLLSPSVILKSVDATQADARWLNFTEKASAKSADDWLKSATPDALNFLKTVFEFSPYLLSLARNHPQILETCVTSGFDVALDCAFSNLANSLPSETEVMEALRSCKQQGALVCGLADLCGAWDAAKVSYGITRLADETLRAAVDFCLLDLHNRGRIHLPEPEHPSKSSGYTVLAMGKHGAHELNFSSDIDIIVFIDPDAVAITDREECVTEFVRMTKRLVKIMQERTAHGYVFRTDLRLRPDPGSMPLAIPISIALNYYESRGQNWERAALIKSRVVAGDEVVGKAMLSELQPFIWRRYLDYAAIADVHSIKRQIQAHRDLGDMRVPGHNVKLGRGGIREIEFFVQTQQLIAGGRMPELREKRTVEMLSRLEKAGWIEPDEQEDMSAAYAFLRDVEHRLQMIADAQTHSLPESEKELLVIARICGFATVKKFSDVLVAHLQTVEKHYAELFSAAPELNVSQGNLSFTGDEDDPGTLETLASLGFTNPKQVISIVRSWHYGRYPAMQSAGARERLTELTPALLSDLAISGAGDAGVLAFDTFLKGLPAGFQLFTLLHANPQLLSLLTKILSSAPRLTQIITRRPHVFDGLLEPGFFTDLPKRQALTDGLQRTLKLARSYEDGLDRARVYVQEQRFLIGIRALSLSITPQQAGLLYSLLAEVMLEGMLAWVQAEFEIKHGHIPGAEHCLLALGNFGTGELTAGSDLDMVFLYRFDPEQDESDGEKSLHASQYYGRFTQRLIAAMSAPTAEGIIYEMDMRLRPAGAAGPIATSLMAFQRYHQQESWTWEKLALTRAKPLCGDSGFCADVNAAIDDVLAPLADEKRSAKEVMDMRKLMDKERAPQGVWDVKLAKGGLIDLEFLAQWSVLTGQSERGGSTADTLAQIKEQTLQNDNMTLVQAHSTFSSVAQISRLCLEANNSFEDAPSGYLDLVLSVLDFPDVTTAEAFLRDTQNAVRQYFVKAMGHQKPH